MQDVLTANDLSGPEQFAVQIIDRDLKLSLPSRSIVYKGFLDLAVAPTACMGHSILRQMRVGPEIKRTQTQNAGDLPVG